MGNVRNVNAQLPAVLGLFNGNCVVYILCIRTVNGEDYLVSQVKAAVDVLVGYLHA